MWTCVVDTSAAIEQHCHVAQNLQTLASRRQRSQRVVLCELLAFVIIDRMLCRRPSPVAPVLPNLFLLLKNRLALDTYACACCAAAALNSIPIRIISAVEASFGTPLVSCIAMPWRAQERKGNAARKRDDHALGVCARWTIRGWRSRAKAVGNFVVDSADAARL